VVTVNRSNSRGSIPTAHGNGGPYFHCNLLKCFHFSISVVEEENYRLYKKVVCLVIF
jgi:hypothetical protein